MINDIFQEMIRYYCGDPKRIQHFTKVHAFSKMIGEMEGLDEDTQFILEAAALVHDIGIKVCEEKYGMCGGKLQEKEGPKLAKELLEKLGVKKKVMDRVCYLVAHHHTYTDIDGKDYQILVEADFLVNIYEDHLPMDAAQTAYEEIFCTKTGRWICKEMFDLQ